MRPRLLPAAMLALTAAVVAAAVPAADPPPSAFKIYVAETAAYQVSFEDLAAAGPLTPGLPSSRLALTHLGESVPIWVDDSGDGRFDPGDHIELVGEHLRGEVSYLNEHARFNVYRLRTDADGGARMAPRPILAPPLPAEAHSLVRRQHLEDDVLFIRLPGLQDGPEELWFWEKLVVGRAAKEITLDLSDLDRTASGRVEGSRAELALHLRGWSQPRHKGDESTPDHRVDVALNGQALGTAEWNGAEPYLFELPVLPLELFTDGDNRLELSVPKRQQADGELLVDVVLLNWIEVTAPRHARIGERQARVSLAEPGAPGTLHLTGEAGEEILVYGPGGWRASSSTAPAAQTTELAVAPEPGETTFLVSRASALAAPAAVALDRPSRWHDPDNRADYVMITHRRLQGAITPLADFHRRRGLAVAVVDVEDVYDEFSHGVRDPLAIRRFLKHAYDTWARPAPRFVLLVGDASWDAKNETAVDANYADWTFRPFERDTFVKNASTPYGDGAQLNRRNYVPTLSFLTYQGHAASDNDFVTVDGDDDLPDMAIGRFAVTEPSEVADIVEKTIRYAAEPEAGPWQERVVFITNEQRGFQRRSDRVAEAVSGAGFEPVKVYPASDEATNEHHTARLLEAFDEGALFVQFYGHGGRYIWRTGPPDLKKNHDLLTLDHLEQLAPTRRLPVVLSLTCYSAPFDHPSADSIGEKLLRIAGRGAVGVIAASWRNSPHPIWGETLLEELSAPGATVGEAMMRAKRRVKQSLFVHTYNLLGDPAVPVALPHRRGVESAATAGPD